MSGLGEFDRLLKAAMGLDVSSIGASAVERAIQERKRACDVKDSQAYLARVRASGAELQALIDSVVIPETWFFRDRPAFEAVVGFVRDEWLPAHPERTLRVLSVPCSTGEEPYSIAMALLTANVPANRFRVDAIDICGRSLEHAGRGIYRKSSFRGDSLMYCQRYLEPAAGGHAVGEAVKRQVRFRRANLLDAAFAPGSSQYDVIFCRNLLIYFDRETQEHAVRVITRLLAPSGLLLVGSSETPVFLGHDFAPANIPMAFALRRTAAAPKPPAPRVAPKRRPVPPPARPEPPLPAPAPPPVASATLDEALKLADQGHFAEAWRRCEDHLRRNGPSADAFHVLGLVRDALGNASEAAACYRKALYLDPRHQDAVVHLALLMEKQGNVSEAEALWNRARRLAAPRTQ